MTARGPAIAPDMTAEPTDGTAGPYEIGTTIPAPEHQPTRRLRSVRVSDLTPHPANSRTHPIEQLQGLCRSISQFGIVKPIVANADLVVLAGHGILEASRLLGLERIPVIVIEGLTETQERAYLIADNRLTDLSSFDADLVEMELTALRGVDFPLSAIGFEAWEPGAGGGQRRVDITVTHTCPSCGYEF